MRNALDAGKSKREALRKWRDKIGSHTDFKHAMKIEMLPKILISDIGEMIKDTGKLLTYIRASADGPSYGEINYEPPVIEGARELIAVIKDGLTYRRNHRVTS